MKDLLVYVADADAQAFLRSILARPQALGTRQLSFDIERHPLRDAGMVQSGAELVRMRKGQYQKALLLWDHHGSGRDHRLRPQESAAEIQDKLDRFTWKDNSSAVVLMPELEEWLWHCQAALAAHAGLSGAELQAIVDERAAALGISVADAQAKQPKELFEHMMRDRIRRTISPYDFEQIGQRASVKSLRSCDSFRAVADSLKAWFPQ